VHEVSDGLLGYTSQHNRTISLCTRRANVAPQRSRLRLDCRVHDSPGRTYNGTSIKKMLRYNSCDKNYR